MRQSAKRERIPDLLEIEEFQRLQAELKVRERILVWLDMSSGLRRGELSGLRWEDIQFQELAITAQRSVVDQVVGNVKTEASKRPIPIDPFIAEDLLSWYRTTKYNPTSGLRLCNRRAPGRQETWKTTGVAVEGDVVLHPTGGQTTWYRQAYRLAHISAHVYDFTARKRRRRKGGAGTATSWLGAYHDGRIRPGGDAGQAPGPRKSRHDATG